MSTSEATLAPAHHAALMVDPIGAERAAPVQHGPAARPTRASPQPAHGHLARCATRPSRTRGQSVGACLNDRESGQPADARSVAGQVDDDVDARDQLAVRGGAGQTRPRSPAPRCGPAARSALLGMDGAGAALVTGVERGQQVDHLGAAHLSDHEAVGPHAQRLTYQVAHRHLTSTLGVGRTRLEPHDVVVARSQLAEVLDQHEPFGWPQLAEQGREQGGFSGARAAGDEEAAPPGDQIGQQRRDVPREHAGLRPAARARRPNAGAAAATAQVRRPRPEPARREAGLRPGAGRRPRAGRRRDAGPPLRPGAEPADGRRPRRRSTPRCARVGRPARPRPGRWSVDQDVGHLRVVGERLQRAEADQL